MKKINTPIVGYDIKIDGKLYCISTAQNDAIYENEIKELHAGYQECDRESIRCGIKDALPVFATESEFHIIKCALIKIGIPAIQKRKLEDAKYEAERKIAEDVRITKETEALERVVSKCPLPEAIKVSDLVRRFDNTDYLDYKSEDYQLISECSASGSGSEAVLRYTDMFGWCVPTLRISSGTSRTQRGGTTRDYAVRVKDGATVRVGSGPHVLCSVTLYFKKSNIERLRPILELMRGGAVRANEIRDRISTRRAQSRRRFYI